MSSNAEEMQARSSNPIYGIESNTIRTVELEINRHLLKEHRPLSDITL